MTLLLVQYHWFVDDHKFECAADEIKLHTAMRLKRALIVILLITYSPLSFATDYWVTMAALNVRSGPGERYSVLFTLQKGDEVVVLSKNGKWYEIAYAGRVGYAYSKFLTFSRTTDETKLVGPATNYFPFIAVVCLAAVISVFLQLIARLRDRRLLKTVTNIDRGTKTERKLVLTLLKSGMPAESIYHDLYLQKTQGEFAQIDLVAVTEVGIIVFEVKAYSGLIYGTGTQQNWTQVLAYGRQKYQFYNPVIQNDNHVRELKRKLSAFGMLPFYSMIVFYGNCFLKQISPIPQGTFITKSSNVLNVVKSILENNRPVYYTNRVEVCRILDEAVANGGSRENRMLHIENIKRRTSGYKRGT